MGELCKLCGTPVHQVSSDEGTQHFAPLWEGQGITPEMMDRLREQLPDIAQAVHAVLLHNQALNIENDLLVMDANEMETQLAVLRYGKDAT